MPMMATMQVPGVILGRADVRWTVENQDLTQALGEIHQRT